MRADIDQAVILAGGKGTRLQHVAPGIPKPLVKIGEFPVLVHQIKLLVSCGINRIFLATNHFAQQIENEIGDGSRFDATIQYYVESEPLGTTGSVKALENSLARDFFVLYGDTMVNMDLTRMSEFHLAKAAQATLALHPNDHPYDSDLVAIDGECRITNFYPKPRDTGKYNRNLVNAGIYILSHDLLAEIEPGVARDFGREVFPRTYDRYRFYGYLTREYIKDMGTPDRLEQVRRDYVSGKIHNLHYRHSKPAVFLDRDGVLVEYVDQLHRETDLELIPGAAGAVRRINQSDYLAVVVTNQPAVARNLCSEAGLRRIHDKLDTLLGAEGAYLDHLYYCPHHPDRGYTGENAKYKIDCDCRKPKTGLLRRAVDDLNINIQESVFIGDSRRDIECANTMNIPALGVRTGVGCTDAKTQLPDLMFDDLAEAVYFLLDQEAEPTLDFVYQAYANARRPPASRDKPFVILIGGHSRSGKSILAQRIVRRFQQHDHSTLLVALDNWLIPASKRSAGMGVLERFQVDSIQSDLTALLDTGEPITRGDYDAMSREKTGVNVEFRYNGEDIVVVDGVVALCLEDTRNRADLRIFCDLDRRRHRERFERFYRWKGLSEPEIMALLKNRIDDEFLIIQESKKFADKVVSLTRD